MIHIEIDPLQNWTTSKLAHFKLVRFEIDPPVHKPDFMLPKTSISTKLGKLPK